jgi:putative addiction module component (TIGR02574 family)
VAGLNEIIRDASALPVEERVRVIDSLLRSLNAPETDVDRRWAEVAQRRLEELRAGRVPSVPGDQVFAKIQERLGR